MGKEYDRYVEMKMDMLICDMIDEIYIYILCYSISILYLKLYCLTLFIFISYFILLQNISHIC